MDPATSYVYETEDTGSTSGFYRFRPNSPGTLINGGVLEMLGVKGVFQFDTRTNQTGAWHDAAVMYNTYLNDMASAPKASRTGLVSLLHAAGAAQAHVESKLDALGLSLPKLAALQALAEAGESLPLGQLAERLSCVKSNITQLVDRLEADGLVSRAPDPHDRRARLAMLTAAGRKAYERGIRIQRRTERELFGALTADEARQLASLMNKLERRAG